MKNVLVLDDNIDIREAVISRLCRHVKGCTVLAGCNGNEGEAILRSRPVDLILTDLAMPGMDGFALIEVARRDFPRVPVCVMTAQCSPQTIERLRTLGVNRWLQKPFRFDALARLVAEELALEYNA